VCAAVCPIVGGSARERPFFFEVSFDMWVMDYLSRISRVVFYLRYCDWCRVVWFVLCLIDLPPLEAGCWIVGGQNITFLNKVVLVWLVADQPENYSIQAGYHWYGSEICTRRYKRPRFYGPKIARLRIALWKIREPSSNIWAGKPYLWDYGCNFCFFNAVGYICQDNYPNIAVALGMNYHWASG